MNSKDLSLANDFARARDLRQELRRLEESISRRADRSPVTLEDEHRMTAMQAGLDSAYQAAGRSRPTALAARTAWRISPASVGWCERVFAAMEIG